MADNDSDGQEIELLIRDLTTAPRVPANTNPAAHRAFARSAQAQPEIAEWVASRPAERRPAGEAGFGKGLALASALSLPPLPQLGHVIRMPGPVTMVRMWVGLALVYSASMTLWPYPKTYFWGLVLYLLSLALALVAGIWGARLSWEARLGSAHTVALGAVVLAVALAAAETLPLL
jgi:hypothetical protein